MSATSAATAVVVVVAADASAAIISPGAQCFAVYFGWSMCVVIHLERKKERKKERKSAPPKSDIISIFNQNVTNTFATFGQNEMIV